jgi:hypothetical protein
MIKEVLNMAILKDTIVHGDLKVEGRLLLPGVNTGSGDEDISSVGFVKSRTNGGISNFAGNSTEAVISHAMKVTPRAASAFPTSNANGTLGEVWIRIDSTNIYVGNTGEYTGGMTWMVIA